MSTPATPNRLLHEKSLYLRKHAYNPIDWLPWGPEALAKAEHEDKPLFVSIGYSSCHWCTVMENEAFSDPEIAGFMNTNFVAIKVDREERPDIDAIYMQALQLMNQQGGWPLNIFLTPGDLVPFYGGTYFPVQDRYGRPGFLRVLEAIHGYYCGQRERLADHKERMLGALEAATRLQPLLELPADPLRRAVPPMRALLAREGMGPSFPMIPHAGFALRMGRFLEAELAQSACERGEDLATGGIFDHVGGGFHRYTVDGTWTVPHFEKMLYDNGQIVEFLSDLWASGLHTPAFERAVAFTHRWLLREMTDARGYFYAAQDADSEGEEGKFYVWGAAELQVILSGEELAALESAFFVSAEGNFEGRTTVLQRRSGDVLAPVVETALAKLFAVRSRRVPAATDTKLIVSWNALMIAGLNRAADVFGRPEYRETAMGAARFILEHQRARGEFYRINYDGEPAIPARAEDYACFIKALIDLYVSTQQGEWLEAARALQQQMDERLRDLKMGGYFSAPAGPDLLIREKDFQDSATPAANGLAAANLVRLFLLTDEPAYLEAAEALLRQFARILDEVPRASPSLLAGYDWYRNQVLVQTDPVRIADLLRGYWPTAVFKAVDVKPAVALVCEGLRCLEPIESEAQLEAQLRTSLVRAEN
ncbi:MAG: thioredoxin domain-containing protein [Aphanocapsa lilacina HA4352-LM1]|jgi:uncharacterized protein YyaL (SSP411 family)|nr:thioredoxin domain-containing protein [Aphanocapsa lilacina HA4352-LM1]